MATPMRAQRSQVDARAAQQWLQQNDARALDQLAKGGKLDAGQRGRLARALGADLAQVDQALDKLERQLTPGGVGVARYGQRTAGPATQARAGASLGRFAFSDFNPKLEAKLDALSAHHAHAAQFPPPKDPAASAKALRADLRGVLVQGPGGATMDVYQKIQADRVLQPEQKARIFAVLAEVRDAYLAIDAKTPAGTAESGYQEVNWKHTRGEIDQVLEATRLAKLGPRATEDALLASIFSDSVKTPRNFIVHNIHGAQASAEVLPRHMDVKSAEGMRRLEGIVTAIEEHQIGPPKFMGMMAGVILRGKLGADKTDEDEATIQRISQKISDPLNAKHQDAAGTALAFDHDELALLAQIGVHRWPVPHADSEHYGASRAVVDGDSLINYASPDGWAKIAAIRGPDRGPFFQDATVFDSLSSAKDSYDDAFSVISDPAKPLAEQGLARTQAALGRVAQDMDSWFAEQGDAVPRTSDGKIAFWDAPLSYPKDDAPLSPEQQAQFEFAKTIRDEVVARLRSEQGVYA